MDSAFFFYLSAVGYFFAFVFYLLHLIGSPAEQKTGLGIVAAPQSWVLKQTTWGKLATWTTLVTVLISTVGMVLRVLEMHRVSDFWMLPVTNTYETLAFFSWAIPLVYLLFEWRYKIRVVGAFATGLAFLFIALASSPLLSSEVRPLVPALQSYWLVLHVSFTLGGEAFFAVAFGAGVAVLMAAAARRESPDVEALGQSGLQSDRAGVPALHVGGISLRGDLGPARLGALLGLGPQRDLDAHHVALLRALLARAGEVGLARRQDRVACRWGLRCGDVHVVGCELSASGLA
jgi:ABC-type transport system involved in cytochrome c biogenesis permease subunit